MSIKLTSKKMLKLSKNAFDLTKDKTFLLNSFLSENSNVINSLMNDSRVLSSNISDDVMVYFTSEQCRFHQTEILTTSIRSDMLLSLDVCCSFFIFFCRWSVKNNDKSNVLYMLSKTV